MEWPLVATLIEQIGIPAVQFIITKIEAGGNATSADIATLLAMANKKASDEMLVTLTAQGIDPASDKGKAFMALVS